MPLIFLSDKIISLHILFLTINNYNIGCRIPTDNLTM